jgi:dTDP-4-amino-4,6-dideoxygalactose transaminase
LVDLKAQYEEIKQEMWTGIEEALGSMRLYLGPNVQAFEKEFAGFLGANHVHGVGSGTDAINIALRAVGVQPGDEVITVSHTFIATVEAIWMAGATPVFADIDPHTYNIDPTKIEELITDKTKAIVPVHIYGQPVDLDAVIGIAKNHGLSVVEDACQAHGAKYKGKTVGRLGDAGCFSFYFSKNLGAFGEAGGVATDREDVAKQVAYLREHGQRSKYEHEILGYNSRIDELQAVILRLKLKRLEKWNNRRIELAHLYNEKLADLPVVTPKVIDGADHVYHLYVIRIKDRERILQHLWDNGVGAGMHYPIPCHLQDSVKSLGPRAGDLSVTEEITKEIVSLPVYPHMTNEQLDYVVEKLRECM